MKVDNESIETDGICNISDYLRNNSKIFPDKPAVLYPDRITYLEMEYEVNRFAFELEQSGIVAGTRTVILIPAGAIFFILTFALIRIGAIPVMIDPGMGITAMAKAIRNLRPQALLGIPKAHLLRLIYPSLFRKVITRIIRLNSFSYGSTLHSNLPHNRINEYPAYPAGKESTAAIFFTSGSTGPAKGVVYTAGMMQNMIMETKNKFNISENETDLCTFPLLGLFALCHGNSSVIADMDMVHPANLDPAKIIKNIKDHSCTQMFGSPMILNKLSKYGSEKVIRLPSLKHIVSAGAPVHKFILESFSRMISGEATIHTPYGATEALPVASITATELLSCSPDIDENESCICIGYPLDEIKLNIIEITDDPIESWDNVKIMPVGEIGEITVKGPWVSKEYFNDPQANILSKIYEKKTGDIWHRMGDLGRQDAKGRIWFYGRKSQRVITEYGTLFTIPCEAVFNSHSYVARSALVGIPSKEPEYKRAVICIELENGNHPSVKLMRELLELGKTSNLTNRISDILFCRIFPVDPRHNAKIYREKLALWALKRIR